MQRPWTTQVDQELQGCGPEPSGQWACAPSHGGSLRTHLSPGTTGGEWCSLIFQGRISFDFYEPPGRGQQLYLQHHSLPKPSQITRRLLPKHLNSRPITNTHTGLDVHRQHGAEAEAYPPSSQGKVLLRKSQAQCCPAECVWRVRTCSVCIGVCSGGMMCACVMC